jgi:hypothetical protein
MDAYVFQAALLCEDCARAVKAQTRPPEGVDPDNPDESLYDSGDYPKGPYPDGGGEADSPQHCDTCHQFLDNPLTGDGETYVRDAFMEYVETGRGRVEVLREWRDAYDWCFDDFKAISLDMRREEKELSEVEEYRLAELCRD